MNGVEGVLAGVAERLLPLDVEAHESQSIKDAALADRTRLARKIAAEQVKALREWAQQDETVEVGAAAAEVEWLQRSADRVVGAPIEHCTALTTTVLTAIFGSGPQ